MDSVRDNRVTTVKSCHGAGKSFVAADIALWFLLTHWPSIVLTTAPTDRQVKKILWKEIRTSYKRAKYPIGGTLLYQELKMDDDWYALGFTSIDYDPDRFQGFHSVYILAVVDEAAGVTEDIYNAIDGVLTTDESRLLMIGNPTNPSGRFAKSFNLPDSGKISISAFDTPNFTHFGITETDIAENTWEAKVTAELPAPYLVTPRWVYDRYIGWTPGSPLYIARVNAHFPQVGNDSLIPLQWIEDAVNRTLPRTGHTELGVDVARYGSDETVIMSRNGPVVKIIKILASSDTMTVAGEVSIALKDTDARVAKIDSIGIGAGVYDRLKELNKPVVEMQSGASALDKERFANARAEWWWTLRERFEVGDIDIPDDETLISQLSDIKYKVRSNGQIIIESKEEMKKRGLQSPDRADTLMLLFGYVHERNIKYEANESQAFGEESNMPYDDAMTLEDLF